MLPPAALKERGKEESGKETEECVGRVYRIVGKEKYLFTEDDSLYPVP